MKQKHKKIFKYILIFTLLILFIKIFFLKNLSNAQTIDDIMFFKLLSNGNFTKYSDTNNQNDKEKQVYKFRIDYKNMNFNVT